MGMVKTGWMIGLVGALALSACAEREDFLPGPREDIRPDARDLTETINRTVPVALPAQQTNATWAQAHGTPAFRTAHPALSRAPSLVWSANIGDGDSRRGRITAPPVVAAGRVFTLDAGAQVMAHGLDGSRLWARDLRPERERAGQATGRGLAHDGGRVYVSSGYGLMTALDAETGAVVWQQKLDSTGSGTPTVAGGLVYLVAGDDTAWAID